MPHYLRTTRSLVVLRLKRQLERESYPRIQMGLLVALTGASGFVFSFLLLRLGVDHLALRYPLALTGAYLIFLLLLWLWMRTRADDYVDVPDFGDVGSGDSPVPETIGAGGEFAGAGASGSFDSAGSSSVADCEVLSSAGDVGGSALDLEELAIPVIAVALAIGLALASLYVVYVAPALFAELLFDGVLSYTLYRRLRNADSSHWIMTAIGRTALPFAATALFLCAMGAIMAAYAPGARSIGEVIRHVGHPAADSGP